MPGITYECVDPLTAEYRIEWEDVDQLGRVTQAIPSTFRPVEHGDDYMVLTQQPPTDYLKEWPCLMRKCPSVCTSTPTSIRR